MTARRINLRFTVPNHARPILAMVLGVLLAAAPARADEIILTNGDRLIGEIVEVRDDGYVLEHVILGRLFVPLDQVESFFIGDPLELQEQEAQAAAEAEPVIEEVAPEKNWELHFDLGLTSASGNTDEQTVSIGVLFLRETVTSKLTYDLTYYWKQSSNDVTDDKLTTGLRHDWLNPDGRWFAFVQGRYDYDQFESWRHRATGHAGPGYRIINQDDLKLSARVGLGARREWGSDDDEVRPEGLAGIDFSWQINERSSIVIEAGYFPSLEDFSNDYRTRETIRWRYKLEENLSLSLGFLHEYQNQVDPGKDHNDTRITIALGLDF